jgi:hypothetical protein
MSMKVFDLACEHDHRFEGWFASGQAFEDQQRRALIECPVCSSHDVRKMPTSPRLNLSHATERPAQPADAAGTDRQHVAMTPAQVQAVFLKMARRIIETTEDVGERFVEEARRIHYREAPERAIRGSASYEEATALREEGIDVFALPLPRALKEPLQ